MSNPYRPPGQCTWYCAEVEPWCLRYGVLGNAKDWAANWRSHGGWVQMTPMVGTIACFQPGSNGADAVFGHVAIVIELTTNFGDFIVSEENGPLGPGRVDNRLCHNNVGVSYLREFAPSPSPIIGEEVSLYQRINGSTYFVAGGSLVTLGTPADIQYFLGLGAKLILEKELSPGAAANFDKLPVV